MYKTLITGRKECQKVNDKGITFPFRNHQKNVSKESISCKSCSSSVNQGDLRILYIDIFIQLYKFLNKDDW